MSGCPSTSLEVKTSSERLKCVHPEVYHCLRDQVGEKTEKCIKPSWIQRGLCAEYNTIAERLDAKGCQPSRGLCPDKAYLSNDVISFSGCAPNEVVVTTINTTSSNDIDSESHDEGLSSIIIVITCIVVLCIIAALGVGFLRKFGRKRRAGNTNKDEEIAESTVPFMPEDDAEEQKNKHLEKEEKHLKYFECKGECPKYMVESIKGHLQNQTNVLIIGKPGSGKTTLAWTACKQMHSESFRGQKWYVKASTSATHLPDDKAMTLILLLDGQFENGWTTDKMVEKVLGELRDNLPSKKVLTIATLSKEAYNRISKYTCIEKLLKTKEIIDLDGKRNTLTTAEMTNVLETHNIFVKNVREKNESNVLSQEQLQAMYDCFNNHEKKANKSPKIGFPLIASLMSLNSPFIDNIKFVKEPIKLICESIKRLRESSDPIDKNKYCTIVYASWKWGYVDTANVDHDLLTRIGEHHGHPGAEIDPEFYVLRKRTDTIYEFFHESLHRAFFAAYGNQYLEFVIEHCPLQVLLEYSVSHRDKIISDEEKVFFLTIGGIEYEKALIRRIRDGNVDIRHHRIWEQNGFQEQYKKIHAKGDVSNKDINMEFHNEKRIPVTKRKYFFWQSAESNMKKP